jgi:hypothetical protein
MEFPTFPLPLSQVSAFFNRRAFPAFLMISAKKGKATKDMKSLTAYVFDFDECWGLARFVPRPAMIMSG